MAQKKKLSEKADKRYRTKVVVGHDAAGNPVVKYASGTTKRELSENTAELRKRYISGALEIEREVLFEVYAESWVKTYKRGKKSAGTDSNYDTALYYHLIPAFKDRQLRAITSFDLQKFLNDKAGKGRTTIGYIYSVIRNVFGKAMAEGIIDRNPTLSLVKPEVDAKQRRALTDAETMATLKVGEDHPFGLLLLILYYTGLRRGEAAGLQWRDIDFHSRTISVKRDYDFKTESIGSLKTKAATRVIPMPIELYKALERVRGIGEAPVLHWLYYADKTCLEAYRDAWNDLRAALCAADNSIESIGGRSILTAHYYRHNYASVLYNAGVDVLTAQKWLGHADAKTTLAIYSHLSEDYELHNAGKLEDAFSQKVAKRLPETKG